MTSLPRGRHGLSREFIADHQRARLFAAIGAVIERGGYESATVSAVAAEAGVSKSDFYAQFASKDDCFLAAYDAGVERLRAKVLVACGDAETWGDGICAGLSAALTGFAGEPAQANLLLVEGLRAGPAIYGRFQAAVESFVPLLRDSGRGRAGAAGWPEATDEVVVGGLASLLSRLVLAGEAARLDRFFPELAEFALSPYLGVAEARRIISSR
ncbi:MAG TPA: TetR/AcrR family transcriptional regulator [Solirubrobacterales bacterium]|nr:TetR/AcrR family transcriptional regulator [Solirubrobacterales bacterium]